MRDENSVHATWVVASYKGDKAKYVQGLMAEGIGYIMIEDKGTKSNPEVVVAFRMIIDPKEGIPPSLIEIRDSAKIKHYEKKLYERLGQKDRHEIPR